MSSFSIYPPQKILNKKLIIGFSGGADSVFLVDRLLESGVKKENLLLSHVNYSLGEFADKAEAFSRDFANKNQLAFVSLKVPQGWNRLGNLEALARNIRLQFFSKFFKKDAILVLAHNLDDFYETIFLQLDRYPSLLRLSSLRKFSKIKGYGELYRPLLEFEREHIRDFLESKKISYMKDPMNEDQSYRRVMIRKEIIPKLRTENFLIKNLKTLSQDSMQLRSLLDDNLIAALDKGYANRGFGAFVSKMNPLLAHHLFSRTLALTGLNRRISRKSFEMLMISLKKNQKRGLFNVGSGIQFAWEEDSFCFFPENRDGPDLKDFEIEGKGKICLPHNLVLSYCTKEKLRVNYSKKSLKETRGLKFPKSLFRVIPEFYIGDELLFSPLLGIKNRDLLKHDQDFQIFIRWPFRFIAISSADKWKKCLEEQSS